MIDPHIIYTCPECSGDLEMFTQLTNPPTDKWVCRRCEFSHLERREVKRVELRISDKTGRIVTKTQKRRTTAAKKRQTKVSKADERSSYDARIGPVNEKAYRRSQTRRIG